MKTFLNPEDAALYKLKPNENDQEVERIRRAHLNDLENIPAFWVLGFLYVLTNPSAFSVSACFQLFAIARIGHSIMYLMEIFPLRAICFGVGIGINFFMGVNVLMYFVL